MVSMIKKIWNTAATVVLSVLMVLVVLLVGLRLVGLRGFTVLSGSMEPEYPTGSVIYVKDADPSKLKTGDVITFRIGGGTVVTHRIVEVLEENGSIRYRTKGDANEIADGSLVNTQNIIGTPVFSVPYLGYALTYIQSPPGLYVGIAVGAWLLLFIFLPSLIFEKGDKEQTISKEEDK